MFSRTVAEKRNGSSSTRPMADAQAAHGEVAHVVAVDEHRALGRVVEAREQPGDRRLAAAGAADERDRLARRQVQVEVLEHRPGLAVAEGDVAQLHLAARLDEVDGAGPVDDLGLGVEDLVDAAGRRRRPLGEHQHEPERAERRLEEHDVGAEGDERADGDLAVDGQQAAVEEDRGQAEPRQRLQQRARTAPARRSGGSSPTGGGGPPAPSDVELLRLGRERLHDPGAGDVLLDDRSRPRRCAPAPPS